MKFCLVITDAKSHSSDGISATAIVLSPAALRIGLDNTLRLVTRE